MLLDRRDDLGYSVSCTTREPRAGGGRREGLLLSEHGASFSNGADRGRIRRVGRGARESVWHAAARGRPGAGGGEARRDGHRRAGSAAVLCRRFPSRCAVFSFRRRPRCCSTGCGAGKPSPPRQRAASTDTQRVQELRAVERVRVRRRERRPRQCRIQPGRRIVDARPCGTQNVFSRRRTCSRPVGRNGRND